MQWLPLAVVLLGTVLELCEGHAYLPCPAINPRQDYTQIIVNQIKNCKRTCNNRVCCVGYKDFGLTKCLLIRNVTSAPGLEINAGDNTGFQVVDSYVSRMCPDVRLGFSGDDAHAADITYLPTEAGVVAQAFVGNGADLSGTEDSLRFTSGLTNSSPLNCVDLAQGCTGLTIAFWAKISENPGNYNYILAGGSAMRFRQHSNKMDANMWRYTSATEWQKTSVSFSGFTTWFDKWIHLALVLTTSDGTLKIYVDGAEMASGTPVDPPETMATPASFGDLVVGDSTVGDVHHNMLGSVDEFMFYGKALTQPEVKDLRESYM